MSCRVVVKLKTALAIKARARALRFLPGRPQRPPAHGNELVNLDRIEEGGKLFLRPREMIETRSSKGKGAV